VDTSLAAQGFQIMAIAGVFSGQMFNFMVGFSLSSFLRAFRSKKKQTFQLFEWDRPASETNYMFIVVFAALLFNLTYLYFKIAKVNK
jgi:Ca2+/Na+ antiporter